MILKFTLILFFILSASCSIYQSDGRKKFETATNASTNINQLNFQQDSQTAQQNTLPLTEASPCQQLSPAEITSYKILDSFESDKKKFLVLSQTEDTDALLIAYKFKFSSDYCRTNPINKSYFYSNNEVIFKEIDSWP